MAFRTSAQLGPQIDEVFTELPYWDLGGNNINGNGSTGLTEPSYRLGNRETGSDGHDYIWVRASAAIAALATGREVIITEPAFTAAAGAGGWYAPPNVAVASGSYFHARKGAIGAP